MIQSVIIEDEPTSAERLRLLLEKYHRDEIRVLRWIQTGEAAEEFLAHNPVDLVFFDVEIGKMTAFEILAKLSKPAFSIIFTTAHEEYALQAIKHSALDYLLKPVDADELDLAISKVKNPGRQVPSEQLRQLLDYVNSARRHHRIPIPMQAGIEYLEIAEIIRCQADVNYTHLFLKGGRKITVAKTLKDFEEMLAGSGFFRIHNSHLVNLGEVRMYHRGKGGYLILRDGSEIEVASRRKEELIKALDRFN
ncbi:response regulator transcription factor [Algoriphagus aestuariicola]|uniref:Response regulator transcription factor n=1 Tax=Algoriphagus aestuariicola TaxID=1852016 RepID=A0ABS3BJS4_9BACT|nr:LytTR family DNA-binding domain-containing protein [Algoriphagus aestuariicola]MBN7799554.1 response regulator transcription factor [Algoriphagus aestuariicola]